MQKILDVGPEKDRVVVMGDFNAQISESTRRSACGSFGYGKINARGDLLLDWMEDNKLVAANTCFQHRCGQRYTCTDH